MLNERTKRVVVSKARPLHSFDMRWLVESTQNLDLGAIAVIEWLIWQLIKLILINGHYVLPRGFFVNSYTFQRLSALVVLRSCKSIGISFSLLLIPIISWASNGFLLLLKFTEVSSCDRADLILHLVEQVWLHEVDLWRNVVGTALHGEIIGVVILIVTEVLAVVVVLREQLLIFIVILLAVIVHGFMNVSEHLVLVDHSLLRQGLETLFQHRPLVAQVFSVLFHMDQSIHHFGTHVNLVTRWGLLWRLRSFRDCRGIGLRRNLLIFNINLWLSTWGGRFIFDMRVSALSRQGSHHFSWLIHWWWSLPYFTCTKKDRRAEGLIIIMRKVAWGGVVDWEPWSMGRSE